MTTQASLLPKGRQQFFDANGDPLVGGLVYHYTVGTSVFADTWSDPNRTTKNANPVVLDDLGSASIYGTGSYRQVVKDAAGNTLWDEVVDSGVNTVTLGGGGSGGGVSGSGTDASTDTTASVGIYIENVIASEAIAAGAPVNFFSSGGSLGARNANGSSAAGYAAHGFAATAGVAGEPMTIYVAGILGGLAGMTPGQDYYLGSGSGAMAVTGVTDVGGVYQRIAVGLTPTSVVMALGAPISVTEATASAVS
jgi:hypothetical protein